MSYSKSSKREREEEEEDAVLLPLAWRCGSFQGREGEGERERDGID